MMRHYMTPDGPIAFTEKEEAEWDEKAKNAQLNLLNNIANDIREERNKKLIESDWVVVASFEKNQNIPAEWEIYRQSLRDVPQQPGFPENVVWPDKP